MLRGLILIALTLALGSGGASARNVGGTPVAFVSVERASQLVAVDLTTQHVIGRVRVPEGPHNVAAYEVDGSFVLVTSPPAGAVTLVDARALEVVKVWRGFGYPHDVEVEGVLAYVTDETRGQLVVIDLRTRRVKSRIAVGPRPHDVAVGDVALVTHDSDHTELTVVELSGSRGRKLLELDVGGPAHDISKQPDSANAYVTYWGSGSVGAIDWGRGRVLWRRKVGTLIHHVAFDYFNGRRLWVTDHAAGRVLLLLSRKGRVVRTLEGCPGAHHVAFGGTAWVAAACHDADALAVWDTRSWRRVLVPVGNGPHGVAVAVPLP